MSRSLLQGFNLSRWAVDHPSFTLFLILACGLAGLKAYLQLGRAEDPSFTIKTAIVSAVWPGATADEIERQVAERVEDKIRQTPYLDYVRTYCLPERMLVMVQLKDTIPKGEVAETWYQLRKKISDIRGTLPEGVIGPAINDEYGDVYSAIIAFTGNDYSPAELKRLADAARKRLLRVNDVEKVDILGEQPQRIYIEISHRKLAALGISARQIFDTVAQQNAIVPAGKIETQSDRIYLRVEGSFDAVDAIKLVSIEAGGKTIRLGDIATVERGYQDPQEFAIRYNGQPALAVGAVMRKGGNVLALGQSLEAAIEEIKSQLPVGVSVDNVAFQPAVVDESVDEFVQSFVEALLIVLVVSFLSLGIRTGIVVALSVPLVLAITLVVMNILGMDLDRISLGALILALGLLVDDAIIAVEMMAVKLEQGWGRIEAATYAWSSTAFPMLSGTIITAAGFLPVGFANSAAGEYAGGIFWVVSISLIASWFVAVIFTPYLGVLLLPETHRGASENSLHDDAAYQTRFYRLLRVAITACVRHPRWVVTATAITFVASMFGFTKLQQQFFPQSSRPELLVDVKLPEGASFIATASAVREIENYLANELSPTENANSVRLVAYHADQAHQRDEAAKNQQRAEARTADSEPTTRHYTSYIGSGAARFFLALNPDLPDPSFAKLVIQTTGTEARERLRAKLIDWISHNPALANARIRVLRLDFGPPVGYPVQFRVLGPDRRVVHELAERVRDEMRLDSAVVAPNLEWTEPAKVVRFEIDQDRVRRLGLNTQEISQTLQTLLTGARITQFREGTESVEVVARAIDEERASLERLEDLTLFNSAGAAIPLDQVARVVPAIEEPILWRRNQEAVLNVRADVKDGVQAPDVTYRLQPRMDELQKTFPPGYRIEAGGAAEESDKANQALFAMFPLMILVMLTFLMLQVQSLKKAMLVFGIAPLGLIGAVAFLHLFDAPFGFVALLGVIALAGMDMRNSVILIDQIVQDREQGRSEWEAVIESAVRRSRPVVLTAATAILAMIPLTRSVFWGPMAIAIMGGLSVATFLTLINLPSLYVMLFKVKPDPAVD